MTNSQKEQITLLRQKGCSYAVIGEKLNLSKDTIKTFCRRNNISSGSLKTAEIMSGRCRECGAKLIQTERRKKKVFCSQFCREKWWHAHPDKINQKAVYSFQCAGCGKAFTAYGNNHRKYCSHKCYINVRFKGGGTHE